MFTILAYKMKVAQGEMMEMFNIYCTFDAGIVFAKLQKDSRVSELRTIGNYNTLEQAREEQGKLRGDS